MLVASELPDGTRSDLTAEQFLASEPADLVVSFPWSFSNRSVRSTVLRWGRCATAQPGRKPKPYALRRAVPAHAVAELYN